jgi:hypothetical protein
VARWLKIQSDAPNWLQVAGYKLQQNWNLKLVTCNLKPFIMQLGPVVLT